MRKKIFKYIIISYILLFIFNFKVSALTCEYPRVSNQLAGEISNANLEIVTCTLSVNTNECTITFTGTDTVFKSAIKNWDSTGDKSNFKTLEYIKNFNECPPHITFKVGTPLVPYEIYATDSVEESTKIMESYEEAGWKAYSAKSSTNVSQTEIDKAYENVVGYTQAINSFINNYSIESCKDESKVITRISECKQSFEAFKSNVNTFKNNVEGYIRSGRVSENDSRVKDFYKAVENADEKSKNIADQLEEEQKQIDIEMGLINGVTVNVDDDNSNQNIEYLSSMCKKDSNVIRVMQIIGYILLIVKILIPIGLIGIGIVNFAKVIISGEEDNLKKKAMSFVWNIIAAIVVFVLPTIINFVVGLIDRATDGTQDYENCRVCIFDPNNCKVSK